MAILTGTAGDDTLCSTTLDETINGFGGTDLYVFEQNFGNDFIDTEDFSPATVDTIHFGTGILPADVQIYREPTNARDIIIQVGSNTIRVDDQYTGTSSASALYPSISQITFADVPDVIDLSTVGLFWDGTAGGDTMLGNALADTMNGGLGNDTIDTGAGDDLIDGQDGDDSVLAGAGDDTITGGIGNDTLVGGAGTDLYLFDIGFGDDFVDDDFSAATLDTIHLGTGISLADVQFHRNPANLRDLIIEVAGAGTITIDDQYTGAGVGSALYPQISQVTFEDSADVIDFSTMGLLWDGTAGNDLITGSLLDDDLGGGDGDDVINTGVGDDTLRGGAGNDTLNGSSGTDTYVFELGFGNDFIDVEDFAPATPDIVHFGSGILPGDVQIYREPTNKRDLIIEVGSNTIRVDDQYTSSNATNPVYPNISLITFEDAPDIIDLSTSGLFWDGTSGNDDIEGSLFADTMSGGLGDDTFDMGAGNDIIEAEDGNDSVLAGDGDDTITGGAGNDTLVGGNGTDTYLFDIGFGDDFVDDDFSAATLDTIHLGTGISLADVQFHRNPLNLRDLIIEVAGAGTITIDDQYTGAGVGSALYPQISQVTFEDSADVIDFATMGLLWDGTSGNDNITGSLLGDNLGGGDGDDTISTGNGDDTLTGGAGNDTLLGGAGTDTYVFELGFGNDFLDEDFSSATPDTVHFGTGITAEDITFYRSPTNGRDLIIQVGTDTITIDDQFIGAGLGSGVYPQISQITFEDTAEIIFPVFNGKIVWPGAPTDDGLFGTPFNDIFNGGAGNDLLRGEGGNDSLIGGMGEDTFNSGNGNDTVDAGDDDDTGFGGAGDDILDGGAGNDLLEGNSGNDTLAGGSGDDTLRGNIGDDYIDAGEGNDIVIGGDGIDTLEGGAGNDTLNGFSDADLVEGGAGDDLVLGGAGDDTLSGSEGMDTLRGEGANDIVFGGADNDLIFGSSGDDTLYGDEGDDVIEGNTQADQLFGDAGNDTLRGGDGFDLLEGGADSDVLVGGNGADTLGGGAGQDILRGNAGNDTFVFVDAADSSFAASDLIDGFEGIGIAGGDVIDLSAIDADASFAGDQAFTFLGEQTTANGLAAGVGSLWLESVGGQTRVYGLVDSDAVIDLTIRINDGPILASDYVAGDFVL